MEPYTFQEGPLPPGIALDYEPAIFNLPAFAAAQDTVRSVSFYLVDQRRKKALAEIQFQRADQLARSPFKAPFGSVEFSDGISPKLLYRFLEHMELQLKDKGVTEIYIKNPPRAYSPEKVSLLEVFFLNQKYVVTEAETGTVLEVTEKPFMDVIRRSEKLRMQQGRKAGIVFHQAGPNQLCEVYDFTARCHREKGFSMPVTSAELQKTAGVFPDRYLLFVVRQEEKIVAASVAIRINKNILYNFLTNHEKEYNHLSPPILLMEGTYDYCRGNGISLIDLGTSALQGKPNFPLLDFKMRMGGIPSSKFSFYKRIG